jgi:hypothetical protein
MREHLQIWYDRWLNEHRPTNLIYAHPKDPHLDQVHFVRDDLSRLVWRDVPYNNRATEAAPRADQKVTAFVIGEHRSKSVRLPVFSFERPDLGLQVVMRYNFYDWNVSVVSEKPVTLDLAQLGFTHDYMPSERSEFPTGYIPGRCWGGCFFQGFPTELQFGPFDENPRKFSLYIDDDYELYVFVRLLFNWRRSRSVTPAR